VISCEVPIKDVRFERAQWGRVWRFLQIDIRTNEQISIWD